MVAVRLQKSIILYSVDIQHGHVHEAYKMDNIMDCPEKIPSDVLVYDTLIADGCGIVQVDIATPISFVGVDEPG